MIYWRFGDDGEQNKYYIYITRYWFANMDPTERSGISKRDLSSFFTDRFRGPWASINPVAFWETLHTEKGRRSIETQKGGRREASPFRGGILVNFPPRRIKPSRERGGAKALERERERCKLLIILSVLLTSCWEPMERSPFIKFLLFSYVRLLHEEDFSPAASWRCWSITYN